MSLENYNIFISCDVIFDEFPMQAKDSFITMENDPNPSLNINVFQKFITVTPTPIPFVAITWGHILLLDLVQ